MKIAMTHRALATTLFLAISFLSGCGGGGSSPPPLTDTPSPPLVIPPIVTPPLPEFAVVSSRPADTASDAPRGGGFAATFSVRPDPASINAASVQLLGPQGNIVPGALSVNGNDVSFVPNVPELPGGTKYTVNFASAIRDTDGRLLNAPYSRSFTTVPQTWGTVSQQIAQMPYFASGVTPRVAIDKSGNVTAVWSCQVSGIETAFASRMDHRTGNWSVPVIIHTAKDIYSGIRLTISADGNDNVYVFWSEYGSGQLSFQMIRYVAATSAWTQPVPINGLPQGLILDAAAVATDSKGIVTMVLRSIFPDGLYGTRFDPAAGTWTIPREIEKPAADKQILNLQLATDSAGNVTLGWVQRRGLLADEFNVARYSADTGNWSAPHTLDDNVTSVFAMAADAMGGATVAWTHGKNIMDIPFISTARFDAGSAIWTTPVRLSDDSDILGAVAPAVVVDTAGIATVVWTQSRGIFGARSGRSTSTWSAAKHIAGATLDNQVSTITADTAGNVVLLYVENSSPMAVQYSSTLAQWTAPVALGQPDGGTNVFANAPVSVIDSAGNVTVVWLAQISVAGAPRYIVAANRFH
jgi:hypothetical protein